MLLIIVHTNSTIDFYVSPCFPYKNVHHPTGASKNSIYKGQLHTYLSVILLNAPLSEKAIDISSFLKFLPQSYKEIVTFLVTAKNYFLWYINIFGILMGLFKAIKRRIR